MEEELNDLIAQVDELYGPRIVSQLDAEVSPPAVISATLLLPDGPY